MAAEQGGRPTARPRTLSRAVVISVAIACGIAGWVLWISILHREAGQDWMVFYTAAKAALGGDLSLVYDGQRLTATINRSFPGWLSAPLNFHPWLYPPHFLLLLIPFAALPFGAAYLLFAGLSFAALLAALCRRTGAWLPVAGGLLMFPQAPFTLLTGQNSFMTGAILVGGFGLLARRPVLAGAILGLGTCKPQMFVLVPVALLAARAWRAIAAAAATAGALVLASILLFGTGLWLDWARIMLAPGAAYHDWLAAGRLMGQSVFACAALLGAGHAAANALQAAAAVLAAGCVAWAFHRPVPDDLRLAVLLSATLLAAPHVSSQDAMLVAAAAILLLRHASGHALRLHEAAIVAAIWLAELFDPPAVFRAGVVTPLAIAGFIAVTIGRARRGMRQAAPRPAFLAAGA